MQIMKLEVLKNRAEKIKALLKRQCEGGLARYGSTTKAILAINERIRHSGRLRNAAVVVAGQVLFVPSWSPT